MESLELPRQLKGSWHHALILTYGADFPFFENALWSQFNASCRHKIILADGKQYLTACNNYARSGLVRYLNQRYIAGGIFTQHAAHAKLILLTNPDKGRLLVGSGNLNWQGYASGGELFTKYEYDTDNPESLGAFLTIRELLEELIGQRVLDPTAVRHINQMLEKTPWLYQASESDMHPVRHNLHTSFLDQLAQAVGDDVVEELWVLSPFYDEAAIALQRLINTFSPKLIKLLVQPGYTSVEPTALQNIDLPSKSRLTVHAIHKENSAYLHSKMYLLKLGHKAICLQGSANLSQVAMLRTVTQLPAGNVELCNLLDGPLDSFDYLLDELGIEPETSLLESLDLSIDPREEDQEEILHTLPFRLTGGEWYEHRLILYYAGDLPSLDTMILDIDGKTFSLDMEYRSPGSLDVMIPPDVGQRLKQPVPVSFRWHGDTESQVSNPIFVCNRATLEAELAASGSDEDLNSINELDIDEDLEQLVAELENALIVDRQSVWQLVGRSAAVRDSSRDSNEDAEPLSYEQIDYEMLRKHPKMQQYLERSVGGSQSQRTRLQIILSAITGHFEGLLEVAEDLDTIPPNIAADQFDMADTEEEQETEEAERQRRQLSREQRIRRIFKNFIRRYLRGIQSKDFQEFTGFEVMVNNFIIFSHLLWQLSLKPWFEPDLAFLFESQLIIWHFFWGDADIEGYFGSLSSDEHKNADRWLREQKADARTLAGIYKAAQDINEWKWNDLLFDLRDFWHNLLINKSLPVSQELLKDSWHFAAETDLLNPPRLLEIVAELTRLAKFNTDNRFLRKLAQKYQFQPSCLAFEWIPIRRLGRYQQSDSKEKCLFVQGDNSAIIADDAFAILGEWMQFEELDYYRISFSNPANKIKMLFYDVSQRDGIYWDELAREEIEFATYDRAVGLWESSLNNMRSIASELEQNLSFSIKKEIVTIVPVD